MIFPKKKAERFQENYDSPEYVETIHALCCAICEVYGFTEAAHSVRRSQGGTAQDLVPLCGNQLGVVGCHHKYDNYDPDVREYEPFLRAYAKRLWAAWTSRKVAA